MPRATKTTKVDELKTNPIFSQPKDRTYYQKGNKRSTSLSLRTRHDEKNPLQYVDENGRPRSLRYCTNQKSVFMDEQEGDAILGRVTMFDGVLKVPKTNTTLQYFLSITPQRDVAFYEFDAEEQAEKELNKEQLLFKAKSYIFNAEPIELKSVLSVLNGVNVDDKPVNVVKQDLLAKSNTNPETIIDLFEDEDLQYLVIATEALNHGLLKIQGNKVKNKNTTIFEVGFNDDPKDMLKQYLKSADGEQLHKFLVKELK